MAKEDLKEDTKPKGEMLLNFEELFQKAEVELPVFVGAVSFLGLIGKYKEQIAKFNKKQPLDPIMGIEEFKKGIEGFLNKKV